MSRKKFKDLNLKDAFLFGAALSDEETCRMILELVLGKKISHVKVHTEHTFLYSSDYRMVRLDVYASDDVQAVSYTHLDVYKRQTPNSTCFTTVSTCFFPSSIISFVSPFCRWGGFFFVNVCIITPCYSLV